MPFFRCYIYYCCWKIIKYKIRLSFSVDTQEPSHRKRLIIFGFFFRSSFFFFCLLKIFHIFFLSLYLIKIRLKEAISLFFLPFMFYLPVFIVTFRLWVVSEAISIYKWTNPIMAFKCIQSLAAKVVGFQ